MTRKLNAHQNFLKGNSRFHHSSVLFSQFVCRAVFQRHNEFEGNDEENFDEMTDDGLSDSSNVDA